jgi:hypothetical protein
MILIETHVTLEFDQDKYLSAYEGSSLKVHSFINYSFGEHINLIEVNRETLITDEMKERYSIADTSRWLLCSYFEGRVERIKMETPINSSFGQSLYHEAHYKLKNTEILFDNVFRNTPCVFPSHNITSDKWWVTSRGRDYEEFVFTHKLFMKNFSQHIEEFEIESVIFDTNIERDYNWMRLS